MWSPILDGELEERADAAIAAIVDALRGGAAYEDASLASGRAGGALLYDYLSRIGRGAAHEETKDRLTDQAILAVEEETMDPSLYSGFTGIAWTLEHLGMNGSTEDDDDDANAETDEALLAFVSRTPYKADYDLVIGLAGLGVYALSRLPRPSGAALLEGIVDRLGETATRDATGIRWRTAPELMLPETRAEYPAG